MGFAVDGSINYFAGAPANILRICVDLGGSRPRGWGRVRL